MDALSRTRHHLILTLGLAAAFTACAALAIFWARQTVGVATFWPGTGLLIAGLLALPRRFAIACAALCAASQLAINLAVGQALAGAVSSGLSAAADKSKIQKTARDFESMFLEQSLDVLNRSEGTDGPLGENGTGGGVYRSMLNKEYAQSIVQSGGVGIGDQVMREMLRLQGGANG